jgi:hypothetical protein
VARKPAQIWVASVLTENDYRCNSETHAPGCDGMAVQAHHICYRSQIKQECYWTVRENGVGLSRPCHDLAHASHGASLAQWRLDAAVDAINARQGDDPAYPEFRIPRFFQKGLAK